jgi:hypothetical protein
MDAAGELTALGISATPGTKLACLASLISRGENHAG